MGIQAEGRRPENLGKGIGCLPRQADLAATGGAGSEDYRDSASLEGGGTFSVRGAWGRGRAETGTLHATYHPGRRKEDEYCWGGQDTLPGRKGMAKRDRRRACHPT